MTKYEVKIGAVRFGRYEVNSLRHLKIKVLSDIENLHPLNSSPEGREEYKNRFRGKEIHYKEPHEKDWNLLS
jgi:hypothetical protein